MHGHSVHIRFFGMNIELNTPKVLSQREKYTNELTSSVTWSPVGLFSDASGWRPGPNLRQKLISEEIGQLTRDIAENRKRIGEWHAQRKRCSRLAEPEVLKLNRSVLRWERYTEALIALRAKLTGVR